MNKGVSIYICTFEFRGKEFTIESDKGINAFKSGFWLDGDLVSTPGGGKLWIPPHKISHIEFVKSKI